MSRNDPAWAEHQRRWLKPDWQRWMRHDMHLFEPPDPSAYRSRAARLVQRMRVEENTAHAAEQKAWNDDIARLRWMIADLRIDLALRRLRFKYGYNPEQPRRPKGDPEGPGRWVDTGGSALRIRLASSEPIILDRFGLPYYQPGGHHEVAREIFGKWQLRPETLKVFEGATTGTIPRGSIRTSPDAPPIRHIWNGRSGQHGIYNQAVRELSDRFLEKNKINPPDMTPDQARDLLKEVRETKDPRIRGYNDSLRRLRRIFMLRTGGRGLE